VVENCVDSEAARSTHRRFTLADVRASRGREQWLHAGVRFGCGFVGDEALAAAAYKEDGGDEENDENDRRKDHDEEKIRAFGILSVVGSGILGAHDAA
jgi:hypothetical protein